MNTFKVAVVSVTAVAAGLSLGAVAGADSPAPDTTSAAAPKRGGTALDPGDFARPKCNPYFPLRPGTVTRLRGVDDGEVLHETVRVTHRTKKIEGIDARVVRDIVHRDDGTLAEATSDWYATDNDATVHYLGERTASYDENGQLESREGSWQAGKHGATAGIIMPGHPRAGDAYRQEFWRGHAEDQAWIVGRHAHLSVPLGDLDHVVRTFEWSRLEPRVVSTKLYAPGVGIAREHDIAGGTETFEVVSVRHSR